MRAQPPATKTADLIGKETLSMKGGLPCPPYGRYGGRPYYAILAKFHMSAASGQKNGQSDQ